MVEPTIPIPVSEQVRSTSARSAPRCATVSVFKSQKNEKFPANAARMPTLHPPAKPRLPPERIIVTAVRSRADAAGETAASMMWQRMDSPACDSLHCSAPSWLHQPLSRRGLEHQEAICSTEASRESLSTTNTWKFG